MLGFEPIAGMTPAGSPLGGPTGLLFICDGGLYEIAGGTAIIARDAVLSADGGQYQVNGGTSIVARHRNFRADGGQYSVHGGSVRIYQSSFFYGDPEILRVPAEVRVMRKLPVHEDDDTGVMSLPAEVTLMRKPVEPRDMVSLRGAVDSVTTEDLDDALGPRLRRT